MLAHSFVCGCGNQFPQDFEELYEPADDTYLLLDALQGELALLKAWKPCCCIELG